MRAAATIVLALSALVCVNAFAGSFYTAFQYTTTDCTGTPSVFSNFPYPLDECVTIGSTSSKKVSIVGTSLSSSSYTSRDCSGTVVPVTGNATVYTSGACVTLAGSGSAKYTFPAPSAPMWSVTVFTGTDCAAATQISGPTYQFGLDSSCTSGVAITMVNGPLQACLTSCNADCTNIPTDSCQTPGSGSAIYASNGVGAQAVVTYATAALIAVAAVVLSL